MKFKIFIIPFFAVFLTAAFWFFLGREDMDKTTAKNSNSSPLLFKEEKSGEMDYAPAATSSFASAQTKKYENTLYGFSFNYPAGFTIREFSEEGRISLIIQNEETSQIFQIYITPFNDKNFEVTSERIKRDIPDLPFSNSADVAVGGKANGVAFFSENEAFKGKTAEVWFADGKIFFQTTASAKDARLLEEIVKSWRFK